MVDIWFMQEYYTTLNELDNLNANTHYMIVLNQYSFCSPDPKLATRGKKTWNKHPMLDANAVQNMILFQTNKIL